ncbi:L,D-transpeptidase family protein [Polycyclovorans algicola]|uniref:L,D-transpeptidase family protein n=1 Tax=Polycyclovorans algicola TaxID=616992 RepID=UPI0012689551|nr:L,D-transpeptidase family protein [Polycyclovorans algicola]
MRALWRAALVVFGVTSAHATATDMDLDVVMRVAEPERTDAEMALNRVVGALRQGERGAALHELEALIRREPDFRAAHWLHAELLAARTGREAVLPPGVDPLAFDELRAELHLRAEAEAALPADGDVPNAVMALAARHPYLLVVDLKLARLYVLENDGGRLSVVRHHYAAIGRNGSRKMLEGDLRTPVGVYHVTQWRDGATLPDLYGSGAFPVDYPNAWDQFRQRTGYGIWLHGVPTGTYTRAPKSSEGCVTMANDDLTALRPFIEVGQTPVVFSDELRWLSPAEATSERQTWLGRLEGWRNAWASVDTEGYLAHYHPEFSTPDMTRAQFVDHKRRVNQGKTFIDIEIDDLNLWRYPGVDEPMVLVEFTQRYRSNNYSSVSQKQQYWRQLADGRWTIFREVNR